MDKREWIEIPYTPAGQLVFDAFYRLAVDLCEAANEATRDFMLSNFPNARTIRTDYVNKQHRRIIEVDGKTCAIIYDFKTKTTAAAELPENWRESCLDINQIVANYTKQCAAYRAELAPTKETAGKAV
jgi:hypothetical protein